MQATARYKLDHGVISRDGQPMAFLLCALYGDGALSASELEAFRCEVVATMNAAPDMLAALEKLVSNWEANHVVTPWDELSSPNFSIDAARAAIAKAVQS